MTEPTFHSETKTAETQEEAILAPLIQACCDRNFSFGKGKVHGCTWPKCFCSFAQRKGERILEAMQNNGWRKVE